MQIPDDYPDSVIKPDPQAFEDPLSNYDPPVYADNLEEALCEGRIGEMLDIAPFSAISPNDTIETAVKRMAGNSTFTLLVMEGEKLLGVISERDVLEQVAERYDEVKDRPLHEVMTPEPAYVRALDAPAKAINLMATGGFRRLPVLDEHDHVIGCIGAKRTTAFLFQRI